MAAYHQNRLELREATALYEKMAKASPGNESGNLLNNPLLMLGVVYRKQRDYVRAIDHLEKLLAWGESNNSPATVATAKHHLAWVYHDQGNLDSSLRLGAQAMSLYRQMGDRRGVADAWDQLGMLALVRQQPDAIE